MKTLMAVMLGMSMIATSGAAFAAKGAPKADSHHKADSKGVPGGQRPKGRAAAYKKKSAEDKAAMKQGTKRQDLKEMNRQKRAAKKK